VDLIDLTISSAKPKPSGSRVLAAACCGASMAVAALAVACFTNEVGAEYGLLSQAHCNLCVLSAVA